MKEEESVQSETEAPRRNKIIKIRASDEEYDCLKARSKKPRLAEWMREYCLDSSPVKRSKVLPVDPNLLRQLAGIGNNLNQIARSLNARSPVDTLQIMVVLKAIDRELCRLRIEGSSL